jgi:hypothetical protein
MEEYLDKLKKEFEKKNIKSFWAFCDLDEFKIIKKSEIEVKNKLKLNPKKYGDRTIANIHLSIRKKGIKDDDWILGVKIDIYEINEYGLINQSQHDSWGLSLKYTMDDLTKRPFKFEDIEKLINIVNDKIVLSSLDGIYYKEFVKRLKNYKSK